MSDFRKATIISVLCFSHERPARPIVVAPFTAFTHHVAQVFCPFILYRFHLPLASYQRLKSVNRISYHECPDCF